MVDGDGAPEVPRAWGVDDGVRVVSADPMEVTASLLASSYGGAARMDQSGLRRANVEDGHGELLGKKSREGVRELRTGKDKRERPERGGAAHYPHRIEGNTAASGRGRARRSRVPKIAKLC